MTPVRSRFFLAIGSSVVMIAGMLFGANIAAAADSVQVQSYQRASQTATCDSPPASMTEWRASWANPNDPTSGPTWHPTWERWANNGNGGWTCTRSITWARSASSARSYAVGDVGPGGGRVFLISGGKTYEMAPKTWGVNETTGVAWMTDTPQCYAGNSSVAVSNCQLNNLYPGTVGEQTASTAAASAIGMGSVNTDAIIARMNAGSVTSSDYAAGAARAYTGGGYTDWFLPSKDELNAMCNYSRNPSAPAAPSVPCETDPITAQNDTFASGAYGFAGARYWSSSQRDGSSARRQNFEEGDQGYASKGDDPLRVRPIRAF